MVRRVAVVSLFFFAFGCSARAPDASQDDAGSTDDDQQPLPDAGADSSYSMDHCNATDPRASAVIVTAQPDDGENAYADFIAHATTSIRVFSFEMGFGATLDGLVAKAKAGVDVRVILDGVAELSVNTKYKAALEAAGAKVEWSDPQFSYMHAKTMVRDDVEALVSTGNYSRTYILEERNYTARLTDAADVADVAALFDADWGRTAPVLSCTRLVVSPINSRDRLVSLVESATTSIDIESMQYDDSTVEKAILAAKAKGVTVRVLLAAPSWITANATAGSYLVSDGIEARWLGSPDVHVKAIVVDGARAYLGSENISYTSLTKNREVGIIHEDAAALAVMKTTFETDWAAATSF
jgi:phosphatidylserine/phosphatidylglycerophosphate/cardiolipin synthase-like enzyme